MKMLIFSNETESCTYNATLPLSRAAPSLATGSLPIFLHKELGLAKDFSTELSSLFSSFNYITPLLGAYLADCYWGRFKTILIFCIVYLAGMIICVISSFPMFISTDKTTATYVFLLGLFGGVAIGSGGIKPNVVTLGADQFDIRDSEQKKEKERYFNYFYWSINIGATFSYGYLTSLAVNGEPSLGIPKLYGFFASFAIPGLSMLVAIIVFISGSSRFHKVAPHGSAFTKFIRIFFIAGRHTRNGRIIISAVFFLGCGMSLTIAGFFLRGSSREAYAVAGMICITLGLMLLVAFGEDSSWVSEGTAKACTSTEQRARNSASHLMGSKLTSTPYFTSDEINDVKLVVRMLPYLSLISIFWACYGQMSNNFVIQGCQMDLRGWFGGHQISAAFLSLFDSLVIMIFIPIFDVCVFPMIERLKGSPFTTLQRIGTGFVFCALSMTVAGFVEVWRKSSDVIPVSPQCANNATFDDSCRLNSGCAPSGTVQEMHTLSVWWESVQYTLIGVGEILTSISSYELFYSQVPETMRSVCQGLNLLTTSVGFMITGGINSVFSFWIPNNLDDGRLENVYWTISGIVLLNFVLFLKVSQTFEYSPDTLISSEVHGKYTEDGRTKETSMSPDLSRHPACRVGKKRRAHSMF